MTFIDLLYKRRSIRKFSNQIIEKEKVQLLEQAALLSPTSRNLKSWEFLFVDDKDFLSKLAQCKEHGAAFLANAPLAIVVIANKNVSVVWIEDTAIASINIQLAALDTGLGSCWIQVRNRIRPNQESSEVYVRDVLLLPSNYVVESIIALGYPAEIKEPHVKEKLPFNKIHYNHFI